MNNLQKDFLRRAVATLEDLLESAQKKVELSPEFLRETFRALHTIKGTSQTFGFAPASGLAHELENLLSAENDADEFKNLLLEGLTLLKNSLDGDDAADHQAFVDKIRRIIPPAAALPDAFSTEIPAEISARLSDFEKKTFVSARQAGKNIFRVKADFAFADFAEKFKRLKEALSNEGEIIATMPNPETEKNKIGFLIYLAGVEKKISPDFPWELVGQKAEFSADADGILSQIAAHGEDLAQKLGKRVEFAVFAEQIEVSPAMLHLIFAALLHLVRNAVDHAVENPEERLAAGKDPRGAIEISLRSAENGLSLRVRDDGRGIDPAAIKAKAVEKNLLSPDEILTENELLDLIFLPEFSTRETISDVSGRGVGLDAVKNLIEEAGGRISVTSLKDAGTTFEVFIPKEI